METDNGKFCHSGSMYVPYLKQSRT